MSKRTVSRSSRRESKPKRRATAPRSARLTPRQLEILTLVRDFSRSHGYSPTLQEVADELGVTKVTVFEHVNTLESKGLLTRDTYKARSLELTPRAVFPDERPTNIPLVGEIAAGAPIDAIENRESLDIDHMFTKRNETFVLRVRGDSMIEDQIRDGDYVVVERRSTARDGETVVALLDNGEATLKRFYREGGRIRLQPANPSMEPIRVDHVRIQGIVIGLLRKY